jgi:hypothetical protein
MPLEPPTPSAQQLADWQALVERIRQGDRSEGVTWEEGAAARPAPATRSWSPSRSPAAPWGTAPAGRLGRWHRRGPSGGSHRGQHDLSPAPSWRCWLDGGLRHRRLVADLLGPASRTNRGAARYNLGWMTTPHGIPTAGVEGIDPQVIWTAKCTLVATRHAGCCGMDEWLISFLPSSWTVSRARPNPAARRWCEPGVSCRQLAAEI